MVRLRFSTCRCSELGFSLETAIFYYCLNLGSYLYSLHYIPMAFLNILEWSVVYSAAWYCVYLRRNAIVVAWPTSSVTQWACSHTAKLGPEMVLLGMHHVS